MQSLPNQTGLGGRSHRQLFSLGEWKQLAARLSLPFRQQQIAFLILAGHGDKQIATILDIGLPTVRSHVGRLLKRLKVRNRQELILSVFMTYWGQKIEAQPAMNLDKADTAGDSKVAQAAVIQ
jgi:DNA-binding CsgD family transcriptional regulator